MAQKRVKLDVGTVYQKPGDDGYYFRYQVNGQRKAVSLKTKNAKEAVARAREMVPIVRATVTEVISAHVKHARGLAVRMRALELQDAWKVYESHPERATPATVSEHDSYRATFAEFVEAIDGKAIEVAAVSVAHAEMFAQHMRARNIAVNTHNRKIRRLRKIFSVLKDYRDAENPFASKVCVRRPREEQNSIPQRGSFSREQEEELLKALADPHRKVMNKPEIRLIYHLGMFTGQRLKDCVLLTWDRVDLNRPRIWVKQFKTGKDVSIPIAPQLLGALREAQEWKRDHFVCPNVAARYNKLDAKGKNTGNNLVNIDVLRVIKWIGLEPSIEIPGRARKVTVYGFHSLRHSFVSHCAEAGIPEAVVVSIVGANSQVVAKHYTHIGEDAQEKAIMAIAGNTNATSDRERIAKALAIIDGLKDASEGVSEIRRVLVS
jgi:integrase